jgi:hypothetical protein
MDDSTNGKKKVQFSTEESFNALKLAYTPALHRDPVYKNPEERSTECIASSTSSVARPDYEDILRRVSIVIQNHIHKCESRLKKATPEQFESGLFHFSQMEKFDETRFISPKYAFHFVRAPVTRVGFLYAIRKVEIPSNTPALSEVHDFLRTLFVKAQLSAECSIVCLIYVERLMENAKVPLVSKNWRPCLLCGLLLASKVWQDLGSWNADIAEIYPQYSLIGVNRLEAVFCREIKWDLYISSSSYAKYYFALRSITEKRDFRRNYNSMFLAVPGAQQVAERSGEMKNAVLSRSM